MLLVLLNKQILQAPCGEENKMLSVHFNLISCAYLVFPGRGQYLQARKGFCGQQRH